MQKKSHNFSKFHKILKAQNLPNKSKYIFKLRLYLLPNLVLNTIF